MSTPGMGARMMHGITEDDIETLYEVRNFGDEYSRTVNLVCRRSWKSPG